MSRRLRVLIWKDLIYRRNLMFITILEIVLPILSMMFLNGALAFIFRSTGGYKLSVPYPTYEPPEATKNCPYPPPQLLRSPRYKSGKVIYQPENPFLKKFMKLLACHRSWREKDLVSRTFSKKAKLNIKFEGMENNQDDVPESLKYTLFPTKLNLVPPAELWDSPSGFVSLYGTMLKRHDLDYQHAVDTSFLKTKNILVKTLEMKEMKVLLPGWSLRLDKFVVPFLLVPIYLFSNIIITSTLVREKVSGAKELVLMMGAKRWEMWLAKFIDSIWPFFISIPMVVLLLHCPISKGPPFFSYVKASDCFIIFLFATISIISFLFFLSSIFTNVLATILVTTAFYGVMLLFTIIYKVSINSKTLALLKCMIPHVALSEAFLMFMDYEVMRKDVKYNEKLSRSTGTLTLGEILIMMTFDAIIFFILTLYLEQVKPGKYGISKSPIFFLKKSYWIPRKVENVQLDAPAEMDLYEEVRGLKPGISIQNVSKVYRTSIKDSFKAVDNVTVDFYENEITGLLGHNGAGKTTLISIICGLTSASSGRALINGYDIAKNTVEARKSLGLCPQHNMLFPTLTAEQNIAFCGMIKGDSKTKAFGDAFNILRRFRMEHVRKNKAKTLSGGQKRKVSLAIALVGDSKVIVLDEPTSGLDPEFRREIWDLLLPLRGSRTVVLTTHYMEEADALCDRIAIMDQGKMKCFATPMKLKTKYGTGYTLSVVAADLGKISKIIDSVRGTIKNSVFKSQNNLTVYFQLPESEIGNFPSLFDTLDNKKLAREIITYSLNITTLEDVFLKVSHDQSKNIAAAADGSPEDEVQKKKYSAVTLLFFQILALFYKKVMMFKKKLVTFLVLNILLLALVALIQYSTTELSSFLGIFTSSINRQLIIPYSLDSYPKSKIFITHKAGDTLAESFKEVVKKFGMEPVKVDDVTAAYTKIYYDDYGEFAFLLMAAEFYDNRVLFHFNIEARQIPPIIMNVIHNAYLNEKASGNITTFFGFRYLKDQLAIFDTKTEDQGQDYWFKCPLKEFVYMPTFMALFFLVGISEEKSYGAKQLQLMRVHAAIYWLVHFIFDFIIFLIPLTIDIVIYGVANDNVFKILKDRGNKIIPSLILWSMTLLLFYYAVSTMFNAATGMFIFGIMFFMGTLFFSYIPWKVTAALSYLHPTVVEDWIITDICKTNSVAKITGLTIYFVLLVIYLILVDSKILPMCFHKCCTNLCAVNFPIEYQKDPRVDIEEEKVRKIIADRELPTQVLVVENLKRWYCGRCCATQRAVRGVTFSVNTGECFGLLGVNGAGKTTTFNMLVGQIVPSEGSAYVDGRSLINVCTRGAALRKIGYCPQFGGFIPCFTCKENLIFFAVIRGVRHSFLKAEVNKWLEIMSLEEHKNKRCLQLSGGNQRKLATAIALIGDAPLLFLDEPTTGVDPAGRRFIWNKISEIREKGQSIVLTSHSMDECEALCSRLTIMVGGQLCCVGETAVLKETFGQGYSVLFKISIDATYEDRDKLKNEILAQFDPGCNLSDEHLSMLHYHITNPTITWKKLFNKLTDLQKKFKILESYSASSTTLEQVFIHFARI